MNDLWAIALPFAIEKSLHVRQKGDELAVGPLLETGIGNCAIHWGMFKGSCALMGPVDRHIPVDVRIPGCPPHLAEILG